MAEAADGALLYVIQMRLLEGLMPVNESDELRQQVLSTIDTTLGQLKTFFDDNHLQDGDLIRPLREQLYHDLILRHYVAQLGQNPEDGNIGQSNSATLDPHLFRARQIREGLQLQPSIGELFLTKSLPPDDAQNLAMSHEHVLDYLILTDSAIRRGSPEEAIDCLETVLSNPIDYFWPQILMALLCLHCDKNLEALEAVAACKQVSPAPQGPRLAFVHILAAQAEYRLARTQTGDERRRNYEHAIGELQQAQDLLSDISTHQEHNRKYLYVTHIQRGSMQLSEYLHLYHYPTDDSLPSWDDDAQSRLRRAKEDIALAADICPDDYLSSFYLARIHDLLGENDDAKWYYEKSLDQGPPTDDSFDVHFHFGMFHQKRREYDEAIEQFRLAEEASQPERQVLPNDTQRASREVTNRVACLVQQARCLMDKASLLESASPKTAQTHLERAKRLYRAAYNRVKEIPELYLSVGKSGEPSERAVLLKLEAEILFRTCRIQPATPEARDKIIALLDEFLSIAPNDADAFALRAITRLQRRDARLWADLRQAANEQQRDDAIRRSLEDIPAIAADFDAAISRYPDQPNTANPRMHLVHYGRGMTRMLLGEWKSAEADFSKAIVLGDGDSKTYARIGRAIALANAGEVDDAMNEADGVAAIIQAESDPSRELALNAAEVYVHISNAVGRDAAQRETWREDCGRCLNSAVDLLAHLMKRLPRTRTQRLWQELEEQHQVLHKGLLQNERYQRILLIERNRTREPSDA
jgi:tetratricopeptide (TPR) repeat protein